jgi:hypothetical protein
LSLRNAQLLSGELLFGRKKLERERRECLRKGYELPKGLELIERKIPRLKVQPLG